MLTKTNSYFCLRSYGWVTIINVSEKVAQAPVLTKGNKRLINSSWLPGIHI